MIKKFVSYYKPHWKLFTLDLICAFLMSALDLVFPMFTRTILNDTLPNRNVRQLVIFVIVLVVIHLFQYICGYFMQYWGHVVGVRIQYDMRKEAFEHLESLPFAYFDENKTGHIMSRIVNDLMEVSELAHHGPEDLFIALVLMIGSFIALCNINVKLTLIIFSFVPLIIWFALSKRIKMSRAFTAVRRKVADVNAKLENSIAGIRVSKSFTNEDLEIKRFDEYNKDFKKERSYSYKYMAEFFSGVKLILDLLQVVVIGAGGYFYLKGAINLPDIVAYILYINFFVQPIKRLTNFMEQFQSGMTGFKRFVELLEVESEAKDDENTITLDNVKGDIEFKNVQFNYDEGSSVLNDLNLFIEKGQTCALVGPSGGGKTTLCHLIPRFYEINAGIIEIDGIDIKNVSLKSLRKNIGMVQQDVFLFTGTIKENISYGLPGATDEEIIEAAKKANIHEFILTLGKQYDTYVGEKGLKLSGGQKQRISIARVFLKNPPILILDEATSALDNESEAVIQKSLDKLSKDRTTIVVAHRLSTIKNADEIVVVTKDGIAEKGTHKKLMEIRAIYYKLYNTQFTGIDD